MNGKTIFGCSSVYWFICGPDSLDWNFDNKLSIISQNYMVILSAQLSVFFCAYGFVVSSGFGPIWQFWPGSCAFVFHLNFVVVTFGSLLVLESKSQGNTRCVGNQVKVINRGQGKSRWQSFKYRKTLRILHTHTHWRHHFGGDETFTMETPSTGIWNLWRSTVHYCRRFLQ